VGGLRDCCRLFDNVTLGFSKDLGAPMGGDVGGERGFYSAGETDSEDYWWGCGGLRQAGVLTAAARVAVEEQFGSGEWGQTGKLRWVHERAKEVWRMWEARGRKLTKPVQTNQVWLDLGLGPEEFNDRNAKHNINLDGARPVLHQIADDAIETLGMLFDDVFQNCPSKGQR